MSDAAIVTTGLGKQFGGFWAVRDFNLTVPRGTVFGLLGPNGAGKSTTINMLLGLLPPTEGEISIFGLNPKKDEVAIRKRVGYVPEHFGFYEWMKVDEIINFVAAYHDHWNPALRQTLQKEFRLEGNAVVKNLSKGTRAKLALLMALAFEPEMLILDEPTDGLDPAARRNFIESILGHYQEEGKTILVSSHLMNEFSGLLDHVAFVREGKVELVSSLDQLHQRMKRVRLIFEAGTPASLQIPDAITTRVNGREAVVTFQNFDSEQTSNRLSQSGASSWHVEEMTLEDIFVDLVGS